MLVNKSYFLDMANTTREISNICRFCLCQNGLIPVSKATTSGLTIQDIKHFTGIQITEEEQLSFAMCVQCCKVLENSVAFRSTCMDNDVIFLQLFSVLIESAMEDLKESKDVIQITIEPLNTTIEDYVGSEELPTDIASTASEPEDTDETQSTKRTKTQKRINARSSEIGANIRSKKIYERKSKLCDICGKLVMCMLTHSDQHAEEKKYTCPHCPVKMANCENMKRHIDSVHLKRIVKTCETCGKGFLHKKSFVYHMKTTHGIGEKTYKCKICSETFDMPHRYNSHMKKWHRAPKEFHCTLCSMTFKEKKRLTIHQRVHSNDQPYACSLCPKRFKSCFARKTHELTHTGIRFSCNLCPKSYRYKSLLSIHHRKDHGREIASEVIDNCKDM